MCATKHLEHTLLSWLVRPIAQKSRQYQHSIRQHIRRPRFASSESFSPAFEEAANNYTKTQLNQLNSSGPSASFNTHSQPCSRCPPPPTRVPTMTAKTSSPAGSSGKSGRQTSSIELLPIATSIEPDSQPSSPSPPGPTPSRATAKTPCPAWSSHKPHQRASKPLRNHPALLIHLRRAPTPTPKIHNQLIPSASAHWATSTSLGSSPSVCDQFQPDSHSHSCFWLSPSEQSE